MRTAFLALAIATALALPVLAPAPGALGATASDRALAPDGPTWRVNADGSVDAPAPVLTALREALAAAAAAPADADAHAALLAAVADAVRPARHVHAPTPASADADAVAGLGVAYPQGDATGDGLSEALLVQVTGGRGGSVTTFQMVSPPRGATLWSAQFHGAFVDFIPDVDLDGDGLTDVLVMEYTVAAPAEVLPRGFPAAAERREHAWHLVALRGSDGANIWQRVDAGESVAAGAAPSPDADARALLGTSFFYAPFVGPDADGDGGADVWLNVFDLAHAYAFAAGNWATTQAYANRFALLSGASGGEVVATALASGPGGVPLVLPSGDLTGDALADSVATFVPANGMGAGATVTAAIDSADGAFAWTTVGPLDSALAVPVADLTGDGLADVVLDSEQNLEKRREALDGATGASLWVYEEPLFLWVVPGDVDGDGASDVLFVGTDYDSSARVTYTRVAAVAGASGDVLYDERPIGVPLPENGYSSIGLGVLHGDFDGDGTLDTVFNTETGRWPEVFTADAHVVRASDGGIQWSMLGTDVAAQGAGDLTGDGRDDAMVVRVSFRPFSLTVHAHDGPTGAPLYERTIASDLLFGVALRTGHDFGGDAAPDLLVSILEASEGGGKAADGPGGEGTTTIEAWGGASGATVWSA